MGDQLISQSGETRVSLLFLPQTNKKGVKQPSLESSRGGLEVELWTDNSLPSASVDRIPLGAWYWLLRFTVNSLYVPATHRRVLYGYNLPLSYTAGQRQV